MPPYYSKTSAKMYERILLEKLSFPDYLKCSKDLRNLIEMLLIKDPRLRLGSN